MSACSHVSRVPLAIASARNRLGLVKQEGGVVVRKKTTRHSSYPSFLLTTRKCRRGTTTTTTTAGTSDDGVDAPTVATAIDPAPVVVDDDDASPPISEAAARANALVASAVAAASADSASLAAASARNTYLPISPGFSLPLPPEPVRFPRAPLNIKFAVLLLRSGYETVDAMAGRIKRTQQLERAHVPPQSRTCTYTRKKQNKNYSTYAFNTYDTAKS